jgi:anhydro-N-acetylmuramic acid kinase
VIGDLLGNSNTPELICIHGQTVFHQPPISWQLVNPAPIARRFSCPIISDLRQADLADGGQGAPITPIADWILFREADERRAIVNLGGFCNVTIVPSDDSLNGIRGFDVCACNQILDAVARHALGNPFDKDGSAARRGRANPRSSAGLRNVLDDQREKGRSLGTGDEAAHWVNNQLVIGLAAEDIAASAVHAIAGCISESLQQHHVDEIILAGGGARNLALAEAIRAASRAPVRTSEERGVPIEARESMAFAVLGALCADGVPITLPQVTGCKEPAPISGVWTNAHLLSAPRG